jgi:hypothetical protein
MYLLIVGWMYVVSMMAVSEALSSEGSVLGALVTFVLYGVFPLSIVWYLGGTRARRERQRAQAEASATQQESGPTPDGSGHSARDAIAPERKEP